MLLGVLWACCELPAQTGICRVKVFWLPRDLEILELPCVLTEGSDNLSS